MLKIIIFTLIEFLSLSFICLGNNNPNTPGHYEARFTTTLPVIDGIGNDTCWNKAEWAPIDQVWIGPALDASDFTGKFKVMWTEDRLYVLVRITDDLLQLQDPGTQDVCSNIYNYDCVEIFIDENNSRETNYSGTFKAIAYHMDTTGHCCYAMGNSGWVSLDDHLRYKMQRVDTHTFDYEYEIKIYNDTYAIGGNNTPVKLTNDKLMGWSIAYNDNDGGSIRQSMVGSIYITGNDKNVSYFNSSVFGELKLVGGKNNTGINNTESPNDKILQVINTNDNLLVTYINECTNDEVFIQLIDCSGRLLQNISIVNDGRLIEKQLNMVGLANGIYFVKVGNKENVETRKVLIN